MTMLSNQWLTDGILDFEYKKYVLLAYLEHVRGEFRNQVLFPHLPRVKEHYQSTVTIKKSKTSLRTQFPRNLVGIDPQKLRLLYEEIYDDDTHLDEINEILEFAIEQFSGVVREGQSFYDQILAGLHIAPIGIIPLRTDEGYLFIYQSTSRKTAIYQYQVTLYDAQKERIVQTQPVDTIQKSYYTTFESMKVELTRRFKHLPNPATYVVESTREYPMDETLLPVARQMMVRYLSHS